MICSVKGGKRIPAGEKFSVEPTNHKYYYFVADKNGKTYFTKNDSEHASKVRELKRKGLWIEYQS